jgi:hypothetical protein
MIPPNKFCGYRFSRVDACAIGIFGGLSFVLWISEFPLWWIVPAVVAHFSLFCNVCRVRRTLEIAWALLFMVNVAAWFLAGRDDWRAPLFSQLPATIAILAWEVLSPEYHGVLSRRINPRLDEYLAMRLAQATQANGKPTP